MLNDILLLYPGYTKVLGPYLRKDGRKHIVLNNESLLSESKGKTKTISYPKALVEIKLKRRLTDDETVDHIDRDFTNDDLSNLQILLRSDHCKLDAKKRKPKFGNCVECGNEFELSKEQIHNRSKSAGPFCSKKCSGKYGKQVQMGEMQLDSYKVSVEYFREQK